MSTGSLQRQVLFLTKYTTMNAAVRYRASQYFPFLRRAGFECTLAPLLTDRYIERLYGNDARKQSLFSLLPEISTAMVRRWWTLMSQASSYDVVWVQYEALPYAPYACERSLFKNARVVVDFDDAVNLIYERHRNALVRRLLGSKIPNIVTASSQVITANRNLATWAGHFNPQVTLIPNAIDLEKYRLDGPRPPAHPRPVIGWIGTPVTARYLRLLARPLRQLRTRHDFVLKVIGVPDFTMEGVDVLAVPWTEESELAELRGCDIGIMPLTDDQWARSKSALKLLQYLAAGIAAVASPVGTNCDVVTDGLNGLLALTDEDWTAKLASMIELPLYRERLAKAGRRTIEEQYSLHGNASRFVAVLEQAASA